MELNNQADKIAKLIYEVDTDARGNLLVLVGDKLLLNAQNFTGNIIKSAGFEYGVNPKFEGFPTKARE